MPNRPSFLPLLTDRLHNFPAPPPNLRVCSTKANMTSYDALFISEATTLFYPNFIFQSLFALVPSYWPRDELAQKRCLRMLIPLHLH